MDFFKNWQYQVLVRLWNNCSLYIPSGKGKWYGNFGIEFGSIV
jgi:hypothetical protein